MRDTVIGIIGSGNIGGGIARLAVAGGLTVVVSNSRGPESLAELVHQLGPQASAGTQAAAAAAADVVVASVPLSAYRLLPADALAGKTVIDTMNYYPDLVDRMVEFETGTHTSSEVVQQHLAQSKVVKAFNNIDFLRLVSLSRPSGASDRSALPLAGNDEEAKAQASVLLDQLGYDAVDIGDLAASWRSEPGTPVYVQPYLSERPVDLAPEDMQSWFFESPGVAVPKTKIRQLVDSATRLPAGQARASLA